ncbi:pyrimidine reductase family protein, partial [Streptomyces sp. KLMMK]
MRRLFPLESPASSAAPGSSASPSSAAPARPSAQEDRTWELAELAEVYAYPEEPGPARHAWLRANMVSSLDGAAHHDGRSQPLSSDADMRIFGTLRGL